MTGLHFLFQYVYIPGNGAIYHSIFEAHRINRIIAHEGFWAGISEILFHRLGNDGNVIPYLLMPIDALLPQLISVKVVTLLLNALLVGSTYRLLRSYMTVIGCVLASVILLCYQHRFFMLVDYSTPLVFLAAMSVAALLWKENSKRAQVFFGICIFLCAASRPVDSFLFLISLTLFFPAEFKKVKWWLPILAAAVWWFYSSEYIVGFFREGFVGRDVAIRHGLLLDYPLWFLAGAWAISLPQIYRTLTPLQRRISYLIFVYGLLKILGFSLKHWHDGEYLLRPFAILKFLFIINLAMIKGGRFFQILRFLAAVVALAVSIQTLNLVLIYHEPEVYRHVDTLGEPVWKMLQERGENTEPLRVGLAYPFEPYMVSEYAEPLFNYLRYKTDVNDLAWRFPPVLAPRRLPPPRISVKDFCHEKLDYMVYVEPEAGTECVRLDHSPLIYRGQELPQEIWEKLDQVAEEKRNFTCHDTVHGEITLKLRLFRVDCE